MSSRAPLLALTFVACSFTACRKAEITTYRVPKEKELPESLEPANPPPASASMSTNTSGAPMASLPVETATGPSLTWSAPAAWTLKPPAPMRKATYAVPATGGDAELSITAFPNSVGGETANLNRWRGQVQLPALSEAELSNAVTRLTINGLSVVVADFSNPQAPASAAQHILGAIVPFEGATWFFKLSGKDAAVASVKPAFLEFLQTLKPSAAPDAKPAAP